MKKSNEEREKRFNELMVEAQRMLRIGLCLWFGWVAGISVVAIVLYETFIKSRHEASAPAILASAK